MQEHVAKRLRISILIWLLLLALAFPYLIAYYERQQEFQWQEMLQPHWETVNAPPAIATAEQDIVDDNAVKGNTVEPVEVEPVIPEPVVAEPEAVEPDVAEPEPAEPTPSSPKDSAKKKIIQKVDRKVDPKVVAKKNNKLTLKLPENLYQGKVSQWDEKKPVVIPDLFEPKKEERVHLSGRLIIDEEPRKKQTAENASYLDSLQGAELNISIKVP